MGPKTAELLNLLLWSAESLVNPTGRHVFETYEGWKYRNGLLIQLSAIGCIDCPHRPAFMPWADAIRKHVGDALGMDAGGW
jgi:hypothetical protein